MMELSWIHNTEERTNLVGRYINYFKQAEFYISNNFITVGKILEIQN